uniref:Uncharacterized protein n=1 Tax=Aegilops tauschii subsp. strangulata TaxID=200361 RepID=A0A453QY99_AEGTS
ARQGRRRRRVRREAVKLTSRNKRAPVHALSMLLGYNHLYRSCILLPFQFSSSENQTRHACTRTCMFMVERAPMRRLISLPFLHEFA